MKKVKMRNGSQEVEVVPSEVQSMINRGYVEVKDKAKPQKQSKAEESKNG